MNQNKETQLISLLLIKKKKKKRLIKSASTTLKLASKSVSI